MLKIPEKIEVVIEKLQKSGYEAYIVGGCVRDMLMGITPHDFDITTNALPNEVEALFEKTVPTGIKHGTVTVIIDKTPIEVTTFRTEGNYSNHRRPESVKFVSTLKEDLSRRDFTVNAMAFNNKSGLVDYFGGEIDIKNQILKAVGDAEARFEEDALRILRLYRFSSVLNFKIDENTLKAAISKAHLLNSISGERIYSELSRAVTGENFRIFTHLLNSGGLSFLNPQANPDYNIIKKVRQNPKLSFFAFLYLSECDFESTVKHLKLANKTANYCFTLKKLSDSKKPSNKAEIKKMLCNTSTEIFNDYISFKTALNEDFSAIKAYFDDIIKSDEPYLITHLKIGGNELKKIGFKGEEIGKILHILQNKIIENKEFNTSENLLEEALKYLS